MNGLNAESTVNTTPVKPFDHVNIHIQETPIFYLYWFSTGQHMNIFSTSFLLRKETMTQTQPLQQQDDDKPKPSFTQTNLCSVHQKTSFNHWHIVSIEQSKKGKLRKKIKYSIKSTQKSSSMGGIKFTQMQSQFLYLKPEEIRLF